MTNQEKAEDLIFNVCCNFAISQAELHKENYILDGSVHSAFIDYIEDIKQMKTDIQAHTRVSARFAEILKKQMEESGLHWELK